MFQSEDIDQIEAMLTVLRESPHLGEVELRNGEQVLFLRRDPNASRPPKPVVARPSKPAPAVPTVPAAAEEVLVTAELVGVFHALPTPIAEGNMVREKQALGQIDAMRLSNECVAPVAGRIVAVRVQDGQPVQYGQTLFEILPEPIAEVAS